MENNLSPEEIMQITKEVGILRKRIRKLDKQKEERIKRLKKMAKNSRKRNR